jgi:TonB family protein
MGLGAIGAKLRTGAWIGLAAATSAQPQVPAPIKTAQALGAPVTERPERYPTDVEAANDPLSWITATDYPARAVRERREGRVEFEVAVSSHGAIRDCRVVRSSGSGDLDDATCQQIRRRAQFRPAYDSIGRAIDGTYRSAVEWRLPALPPPQPFSADFEFTVDTDGEMRNCRVVSMVGQVPPGLLQNNPCSAPVRYQPYRDDAGRPISKVVRMTYGTSVSDDRAD